MDEDQEVLEPFEVTFGDRKIEFKPPTEGQIAVIGKGAWLAQRGGAGNTVNAVALILNVIDKMVMDPKDRNWLEDGLIDGTLDLNDFIGVLDGINAGKEDTPKSKPKKLAAAARSANGRR